MEHTVPSYKSEAFNCPFCNAFSHMSWTELRTSSYYEAQCYHCRRQSLWRTTIHRISHNNSVKRGEMIFPDHGTAPLAELDMPEDVKQDYEEAARIFSKSPRGAAALLRLGLQKLCKHLGEDGKNIHDDIRSLAKKNTVPPLVIDVADAVRITGNNAVHPGTMSDEDFDFVASKMFDLLNFIVKKGISEPKELEHILNRTPEAPRLAAKAKDAKAREEANETES